MNNITNKELPALIEQANTQVEKELSRLNEDKWVMTFSKMSWDASSASGNVPSIRSTNVLLQCLDPDSRCVFILGTMFKVDSRIAGDILGISPEAYLIIAAQLGQIVQHQLCVHPSYLLNYPLPWKMPPRGSCLFLWAITS